MHVHLQCTIDLTAHPYSLSERLMHIAMFQGIHKDYKPSSMWSSSGSSRADSIGTAIAEAARAPSAAPPAAWLACWIPGLPAAACVGLNWRGPRRIVFLNGSWKVSCSRFTCRQHDADRLGQTDLLQWWKLLLLHLRLVHGPVDNVMRCSHVPTDHLAEMQSTHSQQEPAWRNCRACCRQGGAPLWGRCPAGRRAPACRLAGRLQPS